MGKVSALATVSESKDLAPDPDEEIAVQRAPALTALFHELQRPKPSVPVMRSLRPAAYEELLLLAGDRLGAGEACDVLGVKGPNLYGTLQNHDAQTLFGEDGVPIAQWTIGGGRMYYARHIRQLAEALGPRPVGGRRKRKSRKKPQDEAATT